LESFVVRPSLVIWGLFAAACVGFLGYSYAMRPHPAAAGAEPAQRQSASEATGGASAPSPNPNANAFTPPAGDRTENRAAPASADPVFALATDVSSPSSETRATAIRALATAPPKQAISVLQEVLNSGDAHADRTLALNSLREMALNHGDPDNRIRDAIRYAIQNGDAAFVRDANAALTEIESALSRGEPRSAH
jgi:hypothetical protein